MRPRYLEIEGLQSFRALQKVDFDKLGETGLFGIFGPTGSGKSTVLDAVTLALYGSVVRASRGTYGIINTNSDFARVSFTFDLQRGAERRTYRVERLYRRKRDAPNSSEIKLARLFVQKDGCDCILADKPSEVTRMVGELLGLEFDDFTRSVVLPQNRFQEFLLMDKSRKREMLEHIFFLEEYGRQLAEKVNRKYAAARNKLAEVDGALKALGDISEKTLEEAAARMKAASEARDGSYAKLKAVEKAFSDMKEVWELVSEQKRIAELEKEHNAGRGEMDARKLLYENALRAAGLAKLISECKDASAGLAQIEEQLAAASQKTKEAQDVLETVKNEQNALLAAITAEKPVLVELRTRLDSARELFEEMQGADSEILGMREKYKTLLNEMADNDKKLAAERESLESFEKSISAIHETLEGLKVDADYRDALQKGLALEDSCRNAMDEKTAAEGMTLAAAAKLKALEEKLGPVSERLIDAAGRLEALKKARAKHTGDKPADREALIKESNAYHSAKASWESLKYKKEICGAIVLKLAAIGRESEIISAALAKAENARKDETAAVGRIRDETDILERKLGAHAASVLAGNLRHGEPCPVCGSLEHPSPAAEGGADESANIQGMLDKARAGMETANGRLREAEGDYARLSESMRSMEQTKAALSTDLDAAKREYANSLSSMLSSLPDALPSGDDPAAISKTLDEMAGTIDKKQKMHDVWEEDLKRLDGDMDSASQELSAATMEENAIKAEIRANGENLALLRGTLEKASVQYESRVSELNGIYHKYGISGVKDELARISGNDRKSEQFRRDLAKLDDAVRVRRSRLDSLAAERQGIAVSLGALENDGKTLGAVQQERKRKIDAVTGGKPLEQALKDAEDGLLAFDRAEKAMNARLAAAEEEYGSMLSAKSSLANRKEISTAAAGSARQRLYTAISEKGFSGIEDAEKWLLPSEQVSSLKAGIDEYERILVNLAARRELAEKKLKGRTADEEGWNRVNAELFETREHYDRHMSELGAAAETFGTAERKIASWNIYRQEKQELAKKCDLMEQIQKLLRGNSFIEFICEERLRYVAREASDTLGFLTGYRYLLQLDAENGFVIRDGACGGVQRPVSSLSGGETFLAALSLALALSKQIQLKGQSPLEFFFLDEGFGTLDSGLIDCVVDSLERLSSDRRVIGLISHVPELKNRISRRLLIDPQDEAGNGSRARIEKA